MKTNDIRMIIWQIAALIAAYHFIMHVADIVRYSLFMPLKEIWLLFLSPVLLAAVVIVAYRQSRHFGRIAAEEVPQSGATDLEALQTLLIKLIGVYIISSAIPLFVEGLSYIVRKDLVDHYESVAVLMLYVSRPIAGFIVGGILVFKSDVVSLLLSWSGSERRRGKA